MKKSILLILVGSLNLLHGLMHMIQFLQSMFLLTYSLKENTHNHETGIDSILHNPILSLLWALIGLLSLVIGIKDYIHHRRCNDVNLQKQNIEQ